MKDEKKDVDEHLEEETIIDGEVFDVDERNDEAPNQEQSAGVDNNELMTQFVRLQADFTNYKKRVEREKVELVSLGVRKIASDILPVLDNFERAIDSYKEHEEFTEMCEGIELIYAQLIEVLNKNSIEEIKALDEKFDPNFHHAVLLEEKEGYESDIVIEVLQKGYKLEENIIRPAMVKVSK
ncbi:MAG: nucleotide exchange factor GrpE [Tissierellia bacterium]|nr:nucleotide exchange factor GrpE [Tissierellia bacterium]